MAEGRLDREEFDDRVGKALAARTRDELTPLFDDLPGPKPGQAVTPAAAFQAPPWQQSSTPSSALANPSPAPVVAPTSGDRALRIVSAIAWPVTLLVLFATSWHYWWLIFIPIAIGSMLGRNMYGRRHH
jgi:hypothetical protein